jgi:hypothetical protein
LVDARETAVAVAYVFAYEDDTTASAWETAWTDDVMTTDRACARFTAGRGLARTPRVPDPAVPPDGTSASWTIGAATSGGAGGLGGTTAGGVGGSGGETVGGTGGTGGGICGGVSG